MRLIRRTRRTVWYYTIPIPTGLLGPFGRYAMAISGSIFGLGVVLASEPVRHRCPETPPKCPETPPKIRAKPMVALTQN